MNASDAISALRNHDVLLYKDAVETLARIVSEKERPKRLALSAIEGELRIVGGGHGPMSQQCQSICNQAADILKALREVVVPNLKRIGELSEEIKYGPGEALSFEALKALGESP